MNYQEAQTTLNELRSFTRENFEGIENTEIYTSGPGFYTLTIEDNREIIFSIELSVNGFSHAAGYSIPFSSHTGSTYHTENDQDIIKRFKKILQQHAQRKTAAA